MTACLARRSWFRYTAFVPTRILKLDADDENRELQFDLDHLLSLSVEDRFRMVIEVSTRMAEILLERGHRRPVEILKRP